MRLMQAAWREVELVCAFTPSDRKIGPTVRSTCVYVRRLRETTSIPDTWYDFIEVYTEGSRSDPR